MSETCPKCGRPPIGNHRGYLNVYKMCTGEDNRQCHIAQLAYQRGLVAGVELAKAKAKTRDLDGWNNHVNWREVDAELARRCGE